MKFKVFLNFLFFIYLVSAISLYGSPDLTIYPQILGVILTFAFIVGVLKNKIRFVVPFPFKFFILFGFLCFLGTIFFPSQVFFFFTVFQVIMLLIVTYNILLNTSSHFFFYWAFTIGCLIIILLQVIDGRSLLAFRFIVEDRLGATAGNVNDYGYFLSVAITYLFFSWNTRVNKKNSFLFKILKFLIVVLFSIEIIFFTLSKTALILLLIAILAFIISFLKSQSIFKNILVVLTVLFFLVILNPKTLNFEFSVFNRFSNMTEVLSKNSSASDGSTTDRLDLIFEGFRLWSEKPFLGWGPNQFRWVNKTNYGNYAHNNFVEILTNYGLTGFILFYFTHFYLLIKLIKLKKRKYNTSEINWLLTMLFMLFFTDLSFVTYYNKIYLLNIAFILVRTMHLEKSINFKRSYTKLN